jgi:nitrite reductase (NADH) small subunit
MPKQDTDMNTATAEWTPVCALEDIPQLGARVVSAASGDIAIFRTGDDRIFAVHDKCPHKGGPLSQGIVAGNTVTCPLHNWKIQLDSGEAVAPDAGCTRSFEVKVDNGQVLLRT